MNRLYLEHGIVDDAGFSAVNTHGAWNAVIIYSESDINKDSGAVYSRGGLMILSAPKVVFH